MMPEFFPFASFPVDKVGTTGFTKVPYGAVGAGLGLGGSEMRIVCLVEDLDGTPMRTVAFLAGLVLEAATLS